MEKAHHPAFFQEACSSFQGFHSASSVAQSLLHPSPLFFSRLVGLYHLKIWKPKLPGRPYVPCVIVDEAYDVILTAQLPEHVGLLLRVTCPRINLEVVVYGRAKPVLECIPKADKLAILVPC